MIEVVGARTLPLYGKLVGVVLWAGLALAACGDSSGDVFEAPSSGGAAGAGGAVGSGGAAEGGTGGMAGAGGMGGAGGTQSCSDLGDPCTQCEAAACPQTYCDCFNNGECGLLAQCVASCEIGDFACEQPCWAAHSGGVSDGALLVHCAATECADVCPGYEPLDTCQECLYEGCPQEMNACLAVADCVLLLECLDACATPGCENECYAEFPDGLIEAGAVGLCLQRACPVPCAG